MHQGHPTGAVKTPDPPPNPVPASADNAQTTAKAEVLCAIIGIIPGVLGVLALVIVLVLYRDDIRRAIPRMSALEAFGLKVSLVEWSDQAKKELHISVTPQDLKTAIARARNAGSSYKGARILWADDNPDNNRFERRAFTALGADVTVVISNEETKDRIRRADFDVLISDLYRDNGEDPREVAQMVRNGSDPPEVIYYSRPRYNQPTPPTPEAFGVPIGPANLITLMTDVLERRASMRDTADQPQFVSPEQKETPRSQGTR